MARLPSLTGKVVAPHGLVPASPSSSSWEDCKLGAHVLTIKPGFVDTSMTADFDKNGLLWSQPETIAAGIERAIRKRKDTVYLPWFWAPIMLVIKHIPEPIFKKLSL